MQRVPLRRGRWSCARRTPRSPPAGRRPSPTAVGLRAVV
jgi:hypothetical protein